VTLKLKELRTKSKFFLFFFKVGGTLVVICVQIPIKRPAGKTQQTGEKDCFFGLFLFFFDAKVEIKKKRGERLYCWQLPQEQSSSRL